MELDVAEIFLQGSPRLVSSPCRPDGCPPPPQPHRRRALTRWRISTRGPRGRARRTAKKTWFFSPCVNTATTRANTACGIRNTMLLVRDIPVCACCGALWYESFNCVPLALAPWPPPPISLSIFLPDASGSPVEPPFAVFQCPRLREGTAANFFCCSILCQRKFLALLASPSIFARVLHSSSLSSSSTALSNSPRAHSSAWLYPRFCLAPLSSCSHSTRFGRDPRARARPTFSHRHADNAVSCTTGLR